MFSSLICERMEISTGLRRLLRIWIVRSRHREMAEEFLPPYGGSYKEETTARNGHRMIVDNSAFSARLLQLVLV
jgi:hypothetical protein